MRVKTELKFALLAVGLLVAWTLLAWQAGWHERDFAIAQRGKFGLQVHAGPPMEVRYKDLKIVELGKK